MENSSAAAVMESTSFSNVVFSGIPHTYPPSGPVTCCYTVKAPFQPSTRDWVGIFKVGWSTTKDYHTFVWVEPALDVVGHEPLRKQVIFREYYLPKDDSEFYQFCYIDSSGQVRGASTPFCFKSTANHSVDDGLENDLLVITTQEQIEQSVREKEELRMELGQMKEQNQTMNHTMMVREQELEHLKGQNTLYEQEKENLMKELNKEKEQNESIKDNLKEAQQEINHLRLSNEDLLEEMRQLMLQNVRQQEELNQNDDSGASPAGDQEDQHNEVMEQLKQERAELQKTVEDQSMEITELKRSAREDDVELQKLKDTIQLLQMDLLTCEKEKERISADFSRVQSLTQDLDRLKAENQDLHQRLSQQEAIQNMPEDSLQMQLTEAYTVIEEKVGVIDVKDNLITQERQEKELLKVENQNLKRDVEELRQELAELQAANPASIQSDSPRVSVIDLPPSPTKELEPEPDSNLESHLSENLYETLGGASNTEEEVLVCQHCGERFPGITPEELVLHEQSHKVCPFCTLICDSMEQTVFEDHVYGHEV